MLMVEEAYLPMTLTAPGMTDERFRELCEIYPDYFLEYSAEGELSIMPPTDPETSGRNLAIAAQLRDWARAARRGLATESSGGFHLPSGARLSPDAAWISRERLGRRPTCPEFVIELMSPTDRRSKADAKMLEWMANGALLGWLIDPGARSVTIYRPGVEAETRVGLGELAGEGPVEGFLLDLGPVWEPV